MDFVITRQNEKAVKIISDSKLFTNDELHQLFGKYGMIEKITWEDSNWIIYFSSQEEATRCMESSRTVTSSPLREKMDMDSVGDISYDQARGIGKMKQVIKMLTNKNREPSSSFSQFTPNTDPYVPHCSSPMLLNTVEPGFRLAYCHNLVNIKTADLKTGKLNRFNQSIKKYMDDAPKIGTQELVLTNLPPNFKTEDVYKLCGKIEPAAVEFKMTRNINISYANIKAKSKDDFEKLSELLGNRLVNGTKITIIPITKIPRSDASSPVD